MVVITQRRRIKRENASRSTAAAASNGICQALLVLHHLGPPGYYDHISLGPNPPPPLSKFNLETKIFSNISLMMYPVLKPFFFGQPNRAPAVHF